MATITELRQGYLNGYLHRTDGATTPWTDAELDQLLTDSLVKLWPRLGVFTFGDVDTDQQLNIFGIPAALLPTFRVSRIELVNSSGIYLDRVTAWGQHSPTEIAIRMPVATGYLFRVYGWIPFAADGSDLPADLEETVSHRAAARAYGNLAAELLNSERQQNLDSGRVVSYSDAVGLSSYHERLFLDGVTDHPARLSYAPRRAHRR